MAGLVIDGAVEYGTGYALGRAVHQRGETWGKHAPRAAAVVGKLSAFAVMMMAGGPSLMAGALDSVGNAGLAVMGCEKGLRDARKATGTKLALAPASASLPPGFREITAIGNTEIGNTEIGALGQADPGRGLNYDQIEQLAAMH